MKGKRKSRCKNFFEQVDIDYLRPFFIYNYQPEIIERKEEFMELFAKEGQDWEDLYLNEQQAIDDAFSDHQSRAENRRMSINFNIAKRAHLKGAEKLIRKSKADHSIIQDEVQAIVT